MLISVSSGRRAHYALSHDCFFLQRSLSLCLSVSLSFRLSLCRSVSLFSDFPNAMLPICATYVCWPHEKGAEKEIADSQGSLSTPSYCKNPCVGPAQKAKSNRYERPVLSLSLSLSLSLTLSHSLLDYKQPPQQFPSLLTRTVSEHSQYHFRAISYHLRDRVLCNSGSIQGEIRVIPHRFSSGTAPLPFWYSPPSSSTSSNPSLSSSVVLVQFWNQGNLVAFSDQHAPIHFNY